MKVVLISDNGNRHNKFNINLWLHLFLPIMLMVAGIIAFNNIDLLSFKPKTLVSKSEENAYDNFNHIISKLTILDAEVQRLNALNKHLATKLKADINDFDLSNAPAQGGVVDTKYFGSTIVRNNDINNSVTKLDSALENQKLKLKNLLVSLEIKEAEEYLSKNSNNLSSYKSKAAPRNKVITYDFSAPLTKGYISSPFGKRRDPINGSFRHHGGLDIAARKGTSVYAIANGFVSFSGKKGAYGKLLEINHSETLTSRYAHLDSFSVNSGQLVRKGELIGTVGSTGRVTGPHLHLEIRKDNLVMDPKIYLSDALNSL